MTKTLLVALNVFFILAYELFLGGDLSIQQNIPDNANAGETFTVEITIEKGDREGFAKWQQSLPPGFTASAKETAGATFSYKNQEVKMIWMAIPKEKSFTISFDVVTEASVQGTFELGGQFSYIEDNQRKDKASDNHVITITSGEALASSEPVEEEEEQTSTEEETPVVIPGEVIETPDTLVASAEEPLDEKKKDSTEVSAFGGEPAEVEIVAEDKGDNITISRTIQKLEPAKYEVTVVIDKGALNSFGKIEEYLPPNYTATVSESSNSMFSFHRNVAKFLWMVLPTEEKVEIKYFLESTSDELDMATVHGVFSYLTDDVPRTLPLNPSTFENTFGMPLIAEEAEEVVEEEEEIAESMEDSTDQTADLVTETEPEISEEPAAEEEEPIAAQEEEFNQENQEDDLIDEITDIPAPETAVAYKVQIAAGKKEVNRQYFVNRHGINENVNIEYHETWYKYTVGAFPVYKEARDKRNKIWADENKIDDAFVTAYNAGERITVQEALMISQQKWYK